MFKCVLKSVIIKCFNANFREVFISTIEIISKTYYRIFCQVNWLCLFISSMLKTCYEVFSCYFCILFTVWSIPFNSFTKFVSISQTISWNSPILGNRRYQVTIFIVFQKAIDTICHSISRWTFIGNKVIQCLRISSINIVISIAWSVWFWWTSH